MGLQQLLLGTGETDNSQQANFIDHSGTYSWVCPAGVTSVNVCCIGAGGGGGAPGANSSSSVGGGGGACVYKNNISVTPGQSYTVVVGARVQNGQSSPVDGGDSYFINNTTVMAKGGQTPTSSSASNNGGQASASVGDGKYSGGDGGDTNDGGGGGEGSGGTASSGNTDGTTQTPAGNAGGGGGNHGGQGGTFGVGGVRGLGVVTHEEHIGAGGGGGGCDNHTNSKAGGGGGGGYAGTTPEGDGTFTIGPANTANRCGSHGFISIVGLGGWGGGWGGGGGASNPNYTSAGYWCGAGLVRIIWGTTANGSARSFPSTNIGDIG